MKASSRLSILVISVMMLFFTVLEVEQNMLRYNYSPKENNLTIVSPPLRRLYNFNDTITEINRCNQNKPNAIMKELPEI